MSEPSLVCMSEFSVLLHEHLFLPVIAGSDYTIDDFDDVDETGLVPLSVFPGTEWRDMALFGTGKQWPTFDEIYEWILTEKPALPNGYAWGVAKDVELYCELCETLESIRMEFDLEFVAGEQWRLKCRANSSMCHECEKESEE